MSFYLYVDDCAVVCYRCFGCVDCAVGNSGYSIFRVPVGFCWISISGVSWLLILALEFVSCIYRLCLNWFWVVGLWLPATLLGCFTATGRLLG